MKYLHLILYKYCDCVMGIQLQFIVTACIVNFGLTAVPPEIRQQGILEQQAFNAMQKELQFTRNRNAYKRNNFLQKSNMIAKRETEEKKPRERHWKKVYEQDEEILEQWFRELHPDVDNIEWPQIKNLRQKTHQKLCDKVFQSLNPFYDQYKYREELPPDPEGPSSMVRPQELLELKKEMTSVPIVECIYDRNNTIITQVTPPELYLYLTYGNSTRVFTLRKFEDADIFVLQTGLHTVNYSDKKHVDIPWVKTGADPIF